MKKTIFIAAAAIAAMTSCTKEVNNLEPERLQGETITINANLGETKTVFGPNMKSVLWEAGDQMAVILKNPAGTYGHAAQFSKGNGDEFTGTFATPEDGPAETGANTYFALYPYDATISTIDREKPENSRFVFKTTDNENYSINIDPGTQNGLNNMNHIHVPLYGTGTVEGKTAPDISMQHLVAIFKISVKNPGTEAIDVKSVKIFVDGSEKMTGKYRVNTSSDYPLLGSKSQGNSFALLNVTNGTIAPGATGDFYITTSRVRLNAESECTKLSIEIKTAKDVMLHEQAVDCVGSPLIFQAGAIHTKTLEYVKTGDIVPTDPVKFPALTAVGNGNKITISSKLRTSEDQEVPAEKLGEVGVWYSTDKGVTKTEIAGTYDATKTMINGEVADLQFDIAYTVGTFATFDGKKYYSDGTEKTLTQGVNLNESTVNIGDKPALNPNGKCKLLDMTIDGTIYKGVRIGAIDKKGVFGTGSINLDQAQIKAEGNVTLEFYALAAGADEPLNIEVLGGGAVNGQASIEQVITMKEGYDGGNWTGTPAETDHYKLNLTGLTAGSSVKLSVKNHIVAFWGIRFSAAN